LVTVLFAGHIRVGGMVTVVISVKLLSAASESAVAEEADTVLEMALPQAVLALTLTTTSKVAVSPMTELAFEKMTFPVPPTAGVVTLQPDPLVTDAETKVVLAGTASVTMTLLAVPGPLLPKSIV
jgi:hypothetical protein